MTLTELIADTKFHCFGKSSADSGYAKYSLADIVQNLNLRYSEAVSIILKSDGRWQWDDTNQSTTPIATATLVDSQQDYEISGLTFLNVSGVQVKNSSGDYVRLTPADYSDDAQRLAELEAQTGMPEFYVKRGNSILLFPLPSSTYVTLANGIKVFYQRPPDYFASDETSKEPGFNPLYHRYLSVGAALDYALANGITKKIQTLTPMLEKLGGTLGDAYTRRSKDEQPRFTLAAEIENY